MRARLGSRGGRVHDDDRRWIERLIAATDRAAQQLRGRDTDESRRMVEELEALRQRLAAKLRREPG
jgi:predicted trehalose synthase